MEWSKLHDAVLYDTLGDWGKGRVENRLGLTESARRKVSVIADGFIELNGPHRYPWGKSVYVNEAHPPPKELEEDAFVLKLEMQSGDLIVIHAKEIHLQVQS